jgi:uncharacterized protein YcbK (DUF882 family)
MVLDANLVGLGRYIAKVTGDYNGCHSAGRDGVKDARNKKRDASLVTIETRPFRGSLFREPRALSCSPRSLCSFLLLPVIFTCGLVCRTVAEPKEQAASNSAYRLHFFHTHTGERLNIVYRTAKGYDQESLARLNQYLRDHRTGEIHEYDPQVFDLLRDLTNALGNSNLEIDVVCGYRSPRSNEFLRTHGHGVARHSLHMQAMAIDIRIPGIATSQLRDAALALRRGGVGYYAD